MAHFELVMPKLGESIEEATITKWFVNVGDRVEDDDVLLEIATDKVDSEIPSPVAGTVTRINVQQDQTVAVGTVIAIIDTGGEDTAAEDAVAATAAEVPSQAPVSEARSGEPSGIGTQGASVPPAGTRASGRPSGVPGTGGKGRFYSPLVLTIAREEGISMEELDSIQGSGKDGRVQKKDVMRFLETRTRPVTTAGTAGTEAVVGPPAQEAGKPRVSASISEGDEIIEMDRVRKLIAEHMIRSKQTSAHVTNMIEADVTDIVLWRNQVKDEFERREGEKITYLPVFLEATIQALKDFPMINASVDGERIILKRDINLGIAVAIPSGNLIVPVIKKADSLNLLGLTKALNKMAENARNNKLNPDDITGGTFTISNFGTFRNVMGTPIINQPQVAILAIGTVEKKPAVIETSTGDVIGIRHKMFLSLTYDHRIIDGAYGGAYLRKLADIMEGFDLNRTI
jgi:2-oxoglutarate dehydrogenase E2 component (dihydrolipoamide succinyltransferase)